jgi:DNA-directed RNA polymerase subunit RPC12/RpoP
VARFIERGWRDHVRTVGLVVGLVLGVAFALVVLRPRSGTVVTVLFIIAFFWFLTSFYSRAYGYRCAHCKRAFRVPTTVNFFTPSGVARNPDGTYYAWKSLTCPHCGKRTKARVLKRADLRGKETLLRDAAGARRRR